MQKQGCMVPSLEKNMLLSAGYSCVTSRPSLMHDAAICAIKRMIAAVSSKEGTTMSSIFLVSLWL